jgi:hypothetical protein
MVKISALNLEALQILCKIEVKVGEKILGARIPTTSAIWHAPIMQNFILQPCDV